MDTLFLPILNNNESGLSNDSMIGFGILQIRLSEPSRFLFLLNDTSNSLVSFFQRVNIFYGFTL